ncbi:MAG: RecQ family ATP-dependent DNA helicase [Treponema sp.]|nr:RecQ family ATP-dependent DNA helicase [Treponema sp.]
MTKFDILKKQFGFKDFRPGQQEVIDAILSKKDVLAVMPTGAGKSLCYQIPALMLPGMTLVISPLISLMKDQVQSLRDSGCPAAFFNSSLNAAEYNKIINEIMSGEIKLLYVSPEGLQRHELLALAIDGDIPLIVIDEAHCVSQWGHDFRTSYLDIASFIKSIKGKPITAAFTATATIRVQEDIRKLLALKKPFYINTGFNRPNLFFAVHKCTAAKKNEKKTVLLDFLKGRKEKSGIVYCSTRKITEEVCTLLRGNGFAATRYHAGLEDSERRGNQDDFLSDRSTVMVATNAFGMGIDKPNVSFVIHYNMPKNIEYYYQEAGRAGRDGSPANCLLLYSGRDVQINKYLITQSDDDAASDPEIELHNLELLKQMTFYSTSSDCLRRRLLAYFGESSPAFCGNCSNCLTEFKEVDVSLEGRMIVSCVFRLKERNRSFGKTMIIDILKGGRGKKLLDAGLDSLSTWGIMQDTGAQRIRTILDSLIDEGILKMAGDEYPVVTLGDAGPLLREERQFMMRLPGEKKQG